jgi:hypothetical protein
MYQTPSSQESTNVHKKAVAFGYVPPYKPKSQLPVCPCCLLPINGQELALSTPTTPTVEDYLLLQAFYL